MSDIDEGMIENSIDAIWKTYDKDDSGFLDKAETKALVNDSLSHIGRNGEVSEANFEAFFK